MPLGLTQTPDWPLPIVAEGGWKGDAHDWLIGPWLPGTGTLLRSVAKLAATDN